MSDGNSFNSYVNDDDKCPNCGAIKLFSALVCPSCGMSYAETAGLRKTAEQKNEVDQSKTINGFDPNAAFAKYKSSLEHKDEEPAGEEKKDSTEESAASTGEGLTPLSEIEELDKPAELDPIAKKLQEITKQNSGMMGERKYRIDAEGVSEQEKNIQAAQDQGPTYGSTPYGGLSGGNTFSATNYSNPGASSSFQSQTGGSRSGGGAAWTVGVKPSTSQSGSFVGGVPQFGDDISNRYDQYKANSGGVSDGYSSPYSRGAFDVVPEKKKSVAAKIFPLALVLILLAVVGYGCYKYFNSDKNSDGVSYEKGQSANGYYTNEWAKIKFKLGDGFADFGNLATEATMRNAQAGLTGELKDKISSIDLNMYVTQEITENGQTSPIPVAVVMTLEEDDFQSKLFGSDLDDLFGDNGQFGQAMLPDGGSVKLEKADLLLGSNTYKGYYFSVTGDNGPVMNMYVCGKAIGNRIVVVSLYEWVGYNDINAIKRRFESY